MSRLAGCIDTGLKAERLVVEGVRRYLTGYTTGDIRCWEMAWELYVKELGARPARKPISELSCYARGLNAYAARRFCTFPYDCAKVCQDECLIAALIAAVQHNDLAAVEAIGKTIVTPAGQDEVFYSAKHFAAAIEECGLRLKAIDLSMLSLEDCPLKKFAAATRH